MCVIVIIRREAIDPDISGFVYLTVDKQPTWQMLEVSTEKIIRRRNTATAAREEIPPLPRLSISSHLSFTKLVSSTRVQIIAPGPFLLLAPDNNLTRLFLIDKNKAP